MTRDECVEKFKQFVADVGKPRILVTDGAMEFTSKAFEGFCLERRIRHEFSAPYVPEDNGKIERIWGTVMNMARSMVDTARMSKKYWSFALKAAFYIKNRSFHTAIGATPYEVFFGVRPDVSHLRTFGSKCFIFEEVRKKLDAKASVGVLLGYSTKCNSYIVGMLDESHRLKVYLSRSVTFHEHEPYFGSSGCTVDSGGSSASAGLEGEVEIAEVVAPTPELSAPVVPTVENVRSSEVPIEQAEVQEPPKRSRPQRKVQRPTRFSDYVSWDEVDEQGESCFSGIVDKDILPASASEGFGRPSLASSHASRV